MELWPENRDLLEESNVFEKLRGRTPRILDEAVYKEFTVIAPYLPETGEFLFEVRAEQLRNQPGEICFPGGRIEAGETVEEAGVRETAEELLVDAGQIELVAPLDVMVVPYLRIIHPYLALLRNYHNTFNTNEVREVFTVPFKFFLETEPAVYNNRVSITPADNAIYRELGVDSYPWMQSKYPVIFYRYGDRLIWGMTAKFMQNVVALYRDSYR